MNYEDAQLLAAGEGPLDQRVVQQPTTEARPVKYLVIDRTMTQPIRGVVERGGKSVGTTQMLDWRELKDYAKWLGLAGGRELLDAFEVQLINDGMLYVWPVDADGEPLHDECDALEIRHYDDGSRIVWEPKLRCETCCGEGHFNLFGEPVEEEDLCMVCDGQGSLTGSEFETDMQGNLLHNAMVSGLPWASPLHLKLGINRQEQRWTKNSKPR